MVYPFYFLITIQPWNSSASFPPPTLLNVSCIMQHLKLISLLNFLCISTPFSSAVSRVLSHRLSDYPATKVLLKPLTGRRHQLRLHLSHMGHTIVGDFTYSNRRDVWPYRMFLHAHRLVVPSPFDHIDVKTKDPFTPEDPRNKWVPIETLNTLTEETYERMKEAGSHLCYGQVS